MFAFSSPGWLRCVRMHRSVRGGSIEARSVAGIVAPKELVLYEPTFCGFFISVSLALVSQGYLPATHKAQGTRARGTRHQVPARHARISSRLALGGGGEGDPELLGLLAEDEGVSKRVEDRHLLGPLGRAILEPRPHVAVALCCQRGVVLGKVGRGDAEPDARAAVAVVLAQV